MNIYAVTFKGYNGNRDLTVSVSAENAAQAERLARIENPQWFTVLSVQFTGCTDPLYLLNTADVASLPVC